MTTDLRSGRDVRSAEPTSAHATATMRANRGRDTGPELMLRRELHARGRRFRLQRRLNLGGVSARPDLVFPRHRVAVFVDGCFWHGCPEHMTWPVRNADFWRAKIEGNMARGRGQDRALSDDGWLVVRVWEHEPAFKAADVVEAALRSREVARLRLHYQRSRLVHHIGVLPGAVQVVGKGIRDLHRK